MVLNQPRELKCTVIKLNRLGSTLANNETVYHFFLLDMGVGLKSDHIFSWLFFVNLCCLLKFLLGEPDRINQSICLSVNNPTVTIKVQPSPSNRKRRKNYTPRVCVHPWEVCVNTNEVCTHQHKALAHHSVHLREYQASWGSIFSCWAFRAWLDLKANVNSKPISGSKNQKKIKKKLK